MQFHIDGRFQADIRFEKNAWTVEQVERDTPPAMPEATAPVDTGDDDIATFLDDLFLESVQKTKD